MKISCLEDRKTRRLTKMVLFIEFNEEKRLRNMKCEKLIEKPKQTTLRMVFASVIYTRLNFLCCNFYWINLISDFLFKRRRLVFFHLNTGFVIFRSRSEWFCTFFYFFHFIRSSFVSFSNGSHSNDAGAEWVFITIF